MNLGDKLLADCLNLEGDRSTAEDLVMRINESKPKFGNDLRKWRNSEGLTLRELARLLGVSAAFVCDVEYGRRSFSNERLLSLREIVVGRMRSK